MHVLPGGTIVTKANTGPIGLILKCNGEKLPDVHALEFATKYENKLF